MSSDIKKSIPVDRYIGQEIPSDFMEKLNVAGRVQFPLKDTTPPTDTSVSDEPPTEKEIDELIDHVKEMETTAKLLEDMRDDMLKDMNIPPATPSIAIAAAALNGGDTNITYDTFKKAENIINTFPIMQLGYDPVLLALTSDGTVDGSFIPCSDVTNSAIDKWKIGANSSSKENISAPPNQGAVKAKDDYKKKMADMIMYLIKVLWWETIYARTVIMILTLIESVLAKPIDSLFCLIRFKKPNPGNRARFGPISKMINHFKYIMLCLWPKKSFPEYKVDVNIYVYYKKKKDKDKPQLYNLSELCADGFSGKPCPDGKTEVDDKNNDDIGKNIDAISSSSSDAFPEDGCVDMSVLENNMYDKKQEKLGTPPDCADHAITVINAVYDDALNYSEYDISPNINDSTLTAVVSGDLSTLRNMI